MTHIIANRYQIEVELGTGGMGTVYRAIDHQTGQPVAIKQLKSEVAQPELIERFQREGEALRELNHPNIVKMLDTVQQDGLNYLVMEYVSGGDLQTLLRQEEQLPIKQCLRLALDLSDALTRAHKLDIIHRDLKPANILIAEDGTIRLTDFGVALIGQKERVTETSMIIGTLDYLPPEVFHHGTYDTRADIWAFGIILFEMLTGKAPFASDSLTQVMYDIVNEPIPDLEELRPDAPTALVDLVYRMLDKDPQTRLASVRHVGAALEDILKGRDTSSSLNLGSFDTPVPITLFSRNNNLPAQSSAFIGREAEISELSRMLDSLAVRLMTILAPGGMGKTSLSVELGRRQLANFGDGVFFVELAPITDTDDIIPTIAEATGFKFLDDGRTQKQQILDFLANKHMLLIMDNYEHLLDGAGIVGEILKTAPNMQIVATSRQPLKQVGETLFHLSGMDFPDWETPEDALHYAAVKLFMNSALRALPSFELTEDNLDSVARICRLVQGMPLGIVLAASWLAMLSPEEIAQEMQQSMDILEDETGQVPERQHSIRVVMDYSWDIMTEAEQESFMKLSVFRGGFTRESAQEIASANLRMLLSLTNKSLIRRDVDTGRYTIHELLRQYAHEKLQESGQAATTRSTHSRYFLRYGGRLISRNIESQFTAMSNLVADNDNITEAWNNAIETRDETAIENGAMLYLYYLWQAQYRQAEAIFEKALAVVSEDNQMLRTILKSLLVSFYAFQGQLLDDTKISYIEDALATLKDTDYIEFYVNTRVTQTFIIQSTQGLDAWAEALREVQAIAGQARTEYHYMNCTGLLSYYGILKGNYDDVEAIVEDSKASLYAANNFGELSYRTSMIGEISIWWGDYPKARERLQESIALCLKVQNIQKLVDNQVLLGLIAFFEDDYAQVQYHLDEVAKLEDRLGLSFRSIKDAYAIKVRLNLAQGEATEAHENLLELLRFGSNTSYFLDFTAIAAADWLLYQGQAERVTHLLHFMRHADVPPAVRKCAQVLIETLPEHDVEIDRSDFDLQTFFHNLRRELEN